MGTEWWFSAEVDQLALRPYLGFGCKRAVLRPGYLERRGITDIANRLRVGRNLSSDT